MRRGRHVCLCLIGRERPNTRIKTTLGTRGRVPSRVADQLRVANIRLSYRESALLPNRSPLYPGCPEGNKCRGSRKHFTRCAVTVRSNGVSILRGQGLSTTKSDRAISWGDIGVRLRGPRCRPCGAECDGSSTGPRLGAPSSKTHAGQALGGWGGATWSPRRGMSTTPPRWPQLDCPLQAAVGIDDWRQVFVIRRHQDAEVGGDPISRVVSRVRSVRGRPQGSLAFRIRSRIEPSKSSSGTVSGPVNGPTNNGKTSGSLAANRSDMKALRA